MTTPHDRFNVFGCDDFGYDNDDEDGDGGDSEEANKPVRDDYLFLVILFGCLASWGIFIYCLWEN